MVLHTLRMKFSSEKCGVYKSPFILFLEVLFEQNIFLVKDLVFGLYENSKFRAGMNYWLDMCSVIYSDIHLRYQWRDVWS